MSLSAHLAMSLPKNVTSLLVAEVYTVPRLRRLLQMVAAIGWLQGNSSRSAEGRVLGPRSGWLQRYGGALAFRG